MPGLHWESFETGQSFAHEPGRTITEADNVLFCSMTMNTQPLHLDQAWAKQGPFGRPVVNGILTFALAVGISVRDLIEVARRVTGKSFRAVESERRPGDPPRLVADPTRSGSVLGWRPVHSGIEEIVESAWRWSAQRQGSRG